MITPDPYYGRKVNTLLSFILNAWMAAANLKTPETLPWIPPGQTKVEVLRTAAQLYS